MDEAELQEVMRIATDYFRKQASSEEEVQKMLGALAKTVEDQIASVIGLGTVAATSATAIASGATTGDAVGSLSFFDLTQ